MLRTLPIATALTMVIAAGLVHGHWNQRWTRSHAVESAVARLEHVPMTLGDWQGRSVEINREQLTIAEIAGYVARRYENRHNGAAVMVLLVCGRPGPISVHTPDICYAGAGYETTATPVRKSVSIGTSGKLAAFMNSVFVKSASVVPTALRILWSWSADGTWESPDNPRLAFAPRQALYKLYVIRELSASEERIEDDSSLEFLQVLLPGLERALFASP